MKEMLKVIPLIELTINKDENLIYVVLRYFYFICFYRW